jgi:endoglucanase
LSAKPPFPDITAIKRDLGGGVTISLYEHYWDKSDDLLKDDINAKLENIAKSGFKTVRLPISFDIFLQPNSSNLQTGLLVKLKSIYHICAENKLNLIITYFYGKLDNTNINSEIDRISWMWKQIQRSFSGEGYANLFFELYNEPVIDNFHWKNFITTLVQYLRYEDANRIYIIGGTNYNSLDELKELGKLPDEKLFYTFHFYEPFIFTHQGAQWTDNKTYLTGLPYPYYKNKMPLLTPEAKGTSVEINYNKYPHEATTAYITERFRNIAEFCKKNNMPLICTETGVITLADKSSRKNYLTTVTGILSGMGIQTVLWDYDQKFSIKKDNDKILGYLKPWLKKSKN